MKFSILSRSILALALTCGHAHAYNQIVTNGIAGFVDTPLLPGTQWHVNDPTRPQPTVVMPGTNFSENAPPPSDATVLFDGNDLSQWRDQKTGGDPFWKVQDGVVISAKGNIVTTNQFGDIQLHLEFREPTPPKGSGQGRGNSGVIFMGHYEIQVLDCYNNPTYPDGAVGAIYSQHPPLANACRLPGEWETYDILFTVPRFDNNGKLAAPGYATVILNGIVVQNHQTILGDTNAHAPGKFSSTNPTGPLVLQFHHNAVAFRNIWVRSIPAADEP